MSNPGEFERQLEINRRYYEAHRTEIQTTYFGQFVALAFGRIVATGPTNQAVISAVRKLQPQPLHIEVFPAEAEPLFDTLLSPSVEFAG
jgi:hypothetical protein